jgi:hypothetical protein
MHNANNPRVVNGRADRGGALMEPERQPSERAEMLTW